MPIRNAFLAVATAMSAIAASSAPASADPVEYVRVCDAYGAGYFYIPGTETCLRVGGWVRHEVFWNTGMPGFNKRDRGRLEFDARNETEFGSVSSYFRIDMGRWSNGSTYEEAQYSLGIGGLEMGHRDSQWNRFSGYGGLTDDGGSYGYRERFYISYTRRFGDLTGIVSLDHDNNANYMPDIMVGARGTFGNVTASLSAGWDESDASVAVKATVNAAVGPATLRLVGLWTNGVATNQYWNAAQWSVIAGIGAPLGSRASVAVDFQYFQGGAWQVIGDLNYTIAPGLTALAEIAHTSANTNAFMLRFQRSF